VAKSPPLVGFRSSNKAYALSFKPRNTVERLGHCEFTLNEPSSAPNWFAVCPAIT
jgi:hypothetical protein